MQQNLFTEELIFGKDMAKQPKFKKMTSEVGDPGKATKTCITTLKIVIQMREVCNEMKTKVMTSALPHHDIIMTSVFSNNTSIIYVS